MLGLFREVVSMNPERITQEILIILRVIKKNMIMIFGAMFLLIRLKRRFGNDIEVGIE